MAARRLRARAVVPDLATQAEAGGFHHFFEVRRALDAVVRARDDEARAALGRLARRVRPEAHADARVFETLESMRGVALAGANADDRRGLASAVAALGRKCGDCHAALGGGAMQAEGDTRGYHAAGREGVTTAMAEHQWPLAQLWLGLTSPRDGDWLRGARGLTSDYRVWPRDEAAPAGAASVGSALAEAGRELELAQTAEARVAGLSQLIGRCADCHQTD